MEKSEGSLPAAARTEETAGQRTVRVPLEFVKNEEWAELRRLAYKCLDYDTKIETDQGSMKLGSVVRRRLAIRVKAFDRSTGAVVWADVVDWQMRKDTEWVQIEYAARRGRHVVMATSDHEFWTPRGMVAAAKLSADDDLYVESATLTPDQEQVLLGSIAGDGYLEQRRRAGSTPGRRGGRECPHLVENHSESQRAYVEWKAAAFQNMRARVSEYFTGPRESGRQRFAGVRVTTGAEPVMNRYRDLCYPDGSKRFSWPWLSAIGPLGLAVWFMDDGGFKRRRFGGVACSLIAEISLAPATPEELSFVFRYFAERWSLWPRIMPAKGTRGMRLRFSVADTVKLLGIIGDFVQPLEPNDRRHQTKRWIGKPVAVGAEDGLVAARITSVTHHRYPRGRWAYDVTVEPTHTFIASGVASSNCASYGNHLLTESYAKSRGLSGLTPYTDYKHELSSMIRDAVGRECVGLWRRLGRKILRGEQTLARFSADRALVIRDRGVRFVRHEGGLAVVLRLKPAPGDATVLPVWMNALRRDPWLRELLEKLVLGEYPITKATVQFERPGRKVYVRLTYAKPQGAVAQGRAQASFGPIGADRVLWLRCEGRALSLTAELYRLRFMKEHFAGIRRRLSQSLLGVGRGRRRTYRLALLRAGTFEQWSEGPLHMLSRKVIRWCQEQKVGTLLWQVAAWGDLPWDKLYRLLSYKALEAGIVVVDVVDREGVKGQGEAAATGTEGGGVKEAGSHATKRAGARPASRQRGRHV